MSMSAPAAKVNVVAAEPHSMVPVPVFRKVPAPLKVVPAVSR